MKIKRYLIVKADGDVRVVGGRRGLRLGLDEVAYEVSIAIPNAWGEVVGKIEVEMPEPPAATVSLHAIGGDAS